MCAKRTNLSFIVSRQIEEEFAVTAR